MCPPAIKKVEAKTIAVFLAPLIFYAFLVANGWLGADFGRHWDEHLFVEFVDDFHNNGRLIPTFYLYPSFCFYLTLFASFAFRWLHPGLAAVPSLLQSTDFTVFSRDIFVLMASLGVVWVYLLALKITKRFWFACLAGLMFCGSFEFSYHSRWAVSDLIAVQFAILSTLMLFLDMSLARRIGWSAFIAGLAAGTKYTAGIVVLNILILLLTSLQPWKNIGQGKAFLRQLVLVGVLFGFAFFITTPGCIYHMRTFAHALLAQKSIYAAGHMGHTVTPGWEHLSKIIVYFTLVLFSPLPAASVFVAILCLAGMIYACLRREWNVLGLFLVMAIYIAYVSLFKVMIVRNVLYVLPYFVVLAAYGLFALHEQFKGKKIVLLVDVLLIGLTMFSLQAVASATWSIHRKDAIDMKKELAIYLKANPDEKYVFSSGVRKLLPPPAVSTGAVSDPAARLVFLKSEVAEEHFPANTYGVYRTIAGPQDVNFDYYPTWSGEDRIVIIKVKDADRQMLDDLGL